jgi:predicted HAD superfamily Cof-like phosphohydrolase
MTDFDSVGEFHKKFRLPVTGDTVYSPGAVPQVISDETFLYRYQHLHEELHELVRAQRDRDLPGIADALADLVYVALGTAHFYGIPFDAVFAEVQRANMAKERADGSNDPRSKRGSAFDVVKPTGWQPPDIIGVLRAAGYNRRACQVEKA